MIESADEFARVCTSDDPAERERAAWEAAGEGVWLEVIRRFPELRYWVAHNRTVDGEVLGRLADDADPQVRARVAMCRRLSPALQRRLAVDDDPGVRERLAWNARATCSTLAALAGDDFGAVAERARERLAAGECVEDGDRAT